MKSRSNAASWQARMEKLRQARLFGRFFAASRNRLREVAGRFGGCAPCGTSTLAPPGDAAFSCRGCKETGLTSFSSDLREGLYGVRELAPAVEGDDSGVKPPHSKGPRRPRSDGVVRRARRGSLTPPECPTVRSPAPSEPRVAVTRGLADTCRPRKRSEHAKHGVSMKEYDAHNKCEHQQPIESPARLEPISD
jgi:hypothetical protein